MQEQKQVDEQKAQLYQICPQKPTTPSIEGYDFNQGIDFQQLMKSYQTFGLQASLLHQAIEEVNKMIHWRLSDEPVDQDRDSIKQLIKKYESYTSNMISSGCREVIRYLVQHKMVDCIVTSAGGVEEDLMKCLGTFHTGTWNVNDRECRLKAINRIGIGSVKVGNIFVPSENYGRLEDWLIPIFHEMYQEQTKGKVWSPSQMIKRFGERINNQQSVYYWAWKNDIPVFCPAITDGAIGDMMFYFNYKQQGLICDLVQDVVAINKIAMRAKRSGVIILGGGVVKHHILNANIWRNGADHAVYVNTGIQYDGSDAGATASEGISWGKLKMDAKYVKVWAEASLVFPLIVAETFAKHQGSASRL